MNSKLKSSRTFLVRIILVFGVSIGLLFFIPSLSQAESGGIQSDTTWTVVNSPYTVTGDVTVFPGATLTIEPGVEVIFSSATKLEIRGVLVAEGTKANRIVFKSSAPGVKGIWVGIKIGVDSSNGGSASIKYVTVSEARTGINVRYSDVTISDSIFNLP